MPTTVFGPPSRLEKTLVLSASIVLFAMIIAARLADARTYPWTAIILFPAGILLFMMTILGFGRMVRESIDDGTRKGRSLGFWLSLAAMVSGAVFACLPFALSGRLTRYPYDPFAFFVLILPLGILIGGSCGMFITLKSRT